MNCIRIQSPNGKITVEFALKEFKNRIDCSMYKITYGGDRTIIDWSSMGFLLKGTEPLEQDFEILMSEDDFRDETWIPVAGEKNKIRDHYKEVIIHLREKVVPFRCKVRSDHCTVASNTRIHRRIGANRGLAMRLVPQK